MGFKIRSLLTLCLLSLMLTFSADFVSKSFAAITPSCTPVSIYGAGDPRQLCGGLSVTPHLSEPNKFYVEWYYKSVPGIGYAFIDKPKFMISDGDEVYVSPGLSCVPAVGSTRFTEPSDGDNISATDLNYDGRPTAKIFKYECTYTPAGIEPTMTGVMMTTPVCTWGPLCVQVPHNVAYVDYDFLTPSSDGNHVISSITFATNGDLKIQIFRDGMVNRTNFWIRIVEGDAPQTTGYKDISCTSTGYGGSGTADWGDGGYYIRGLQSGSYTYPTITCSIGGASTLPFGQYTVMLRSTPQSLTASPLDPPPSIDIKTEDYKVITISAIAFDPPRVTYTAAPNASYVLSRKVSIKLRAIRDSSGYKIEAYDSSNAVVDSCTITETTAGQFTQVCNFYHAPGGPIGAPLRYNLKIKDSSGTLVTTTSDQYAYLDVIEMVPSEITGSGNCTCSLNSGVCSNPTPLSGTYRILTNYCFAGTTPKPACTPPAASCTCTCAGTLAITPGSGITGSTVTVGPSVYDTGDLIGFLRDVHNLLIALGVVCSVFLLPYGAVLIGSGSPENIKKGWDIIKAVVIGLSVLILSGTIIRLLGSELIGLS